MSKLLRIRPGVVCLVRRMTAHGPTSSGITYENKAYPWEDVNIEKIDYSGKYGKVPNSKIMMWQMDLQSHFCKDDGLHVWQKGGLVDTILNYSMLLAVISVYGMAVAVFYTLEYPPCPKKAFPDDFYRPEEQDDGKVWHPYGCGHKGCPP